jgi:hypothetical protein
MGLFAFTKNMENEEHLENSKHLLVDFIALIFCVFCIVDFEASGEANKGQEDDGSCCKTILRKREKKNKTLIA